MMINSVTLSVKEMFNNSNCRMIVYFGLVIFLSGCQPMMRLITGTKSKIDVIAENKERLVYYQPYLDADNVSIYTFKSLEEICKYISYFGSQVSTVYFEDIENSQYFKISCFDDIRYIFDDMNKGEDVSYWDPVSAEDFLPIKNYIIQSSERVYYQENQSQPKKWNIYLFSGTFMGKKLRKRTATLTKIEQLNFLYILDLSIDANNNTITEQYFDIIECEGLITKK